MTKKHKTTNKHFKLFCDTATYWLKRFGVLDYDVEYQHKNVKEGLGETRYDVLNRWAEIQLSVDFGGVVPTDREIKMTAFHEVIELMMAELICVAGSRYCVSGDDIERTKHRIIRQVENAFFSDYEDKP